MGSAKLTDLNPSWMSVDKDEDGSDGVISYQSGFDKARGIMFDCPSCLDELSKPRINGHKVAVWWSNPSWFGKHVHIWSKSGSSFEDLTLNPSLDGTGTGSCKFHGWLKNGLVTW